jgi:alcohol dehydrogenase (NADP+)
LIHALRAYLPIEGVCQLTKNKFINLVMENSIVKAYGAASPDADLVQINIKRRTLTSEDVEIDILYCGVCHSDLHTARNDWGGTIYPTVPGHEIVGKVTQVGNEVSRFKVGDIVGVGCLVDSCRTCESCKKDLEQYCLNGFTGTYNGHEKYLDEQTFGGYAEKIVVDEHFVLKIPANLDAASAAPLLCAGITTWSPLKHWKVKEGSKVAVIGLGGLGHMAIKLAKGLGADVSLFSRSKGKTADARKLGADEVIISTNSDQMESVAGKFDLIIDTVPYIHDINPYVATLNINGTLVLVGYLGELDPMLNSVPLILGRKSVAGSVIGGVAETQEMLDFCGEKNIVCDIEMVKMQEINTVYEKMLKSEVKYRFVIDMASLKN